ncbi:hypothetical protein F5878DRAFT_549834 [Lentinula raphanica]|uniref:Uncharacterized protein n=1 Tax=Lentinula raphanica TaxID=153919 RepID=A0AA38NV48_9AGAR|nr:hypothetical protein F5878DRAFT_549834 [Lentinula raphanica]
MRSEAPRTGNQRPFEPQSLSGSVSWGCNRGRRDAASLDSAKGAHTGKPGTAAKLGSQTEICREYQVQELLDRGFEHLSWDGRTPTPIIDPSGLIIGVLAGQPGTDYALSLQEVFELFTQAGQEAGLQAINHLGPHKRGDFPAFNRGSTMGMGSPTPVALQTGFMGPILDRLVAHKAVRRMAAYQDAAFALWAPRLYAEYQRTTSGTLKSYRLRGDYPPNTRT